MYELQQTDKFKAWLAGLRDGKAQTRVAARLRAATEGNFGDCKPVGGAVFEMRVDEGPGYRLYYTRIGAMIYLMLAGGSKSTQRADIKLAISMAKELKL